MRGQIRSNPDTGRDTVRVQVQDLREGDQLSPSMRTVTMRPYRCARCPAGKVSIGIDGRRQQWGAYTKVSIVWPRGDGKP